MKQNEIFAYLAGLLDGEGYVGIKKTQHRKDCINPQYHERIQIRMVEEKAIKLFKETFGGNYYQETEHSKYSKKPLYCYQASDKLAAEIIIILLPFILIKKRQAEFILRLRKNKENPKSKNWRTITPCSLAYREKLYQKIKTIHNS